MFFEEKEDEENFASKTKYCYISCSSVTSVGISNSWHNFVLLFEDSEVHEVPCCSKLA